MKTLMDIFDEPEKLEKLKIYPERTLKHKLSNTNMGPSIISSQVPVTTKCVARPVDEVSQQSRPGKVTYAQFCQRARQSVGPNSVDTNSSAHPMPKKPKQFSVPLIQKSHVIQNEVSNVNSGIGYSVQNASPNTTPNNSPIRGPCKSSLEPTLTPPPPCSPASQSDHCYTARTNFVAAAKPGKRCGDSNCGPCFAVDCGTCSHCMNRALR